MYGWEKIIKNTLENFVALKSIEKRTPFKSSFDKSYIVPLLLLVVI